MPAKLLSRRLSISLLIGLTLASEAQGPGDTPIVIVGGSLTFRQGVTGGVWTPNAPGPNYSTTAAAPITTIVVKDRNNGDRLRINVGSSSTWEIDVNSDLTPGTPAAVITPDALKTTLTVNVTDSNGMLVKVSPTDLVFRKQGCSGTGCDVGFTSITVIIDSIQIGTLNCNQSGAGHCNIVLRE